MNQYIVFSVSRRLVSIVKLSIVIAFLFVIGWGADIDNTQVQEFTVKEVSADFTGISRNYTTTSCSTVWTGQYWGGQSHRDACAPSRGARTAGPAHL